MIIKTEKLIDWLYRASMPGTADIIEKYIKTVEGYKCNDCIEYDRNHRYCHFFKTQMARDDFCSYYEKV